MHNRRVVMASTGPVTVPETETFVGRFVGTHVMHFQFSADANNAVLAITLRHDDGTEICSWQSMSYRTGWAHIAPRRAVNVHLSSVPPCRVRVNVKGWGPVVANAAIDVALAGTNIPETIFAALRSAWDAGDPTATPAEVPTGHPAAPPDAPARVG